MSPKVAAQIDARLAAQPDEVRLLPSEERDRLIISAVQVDGTWVIKSRYGDRIWQLTGGTTNSNAASKALNFNQVPTAFRSAAKEVLYRYLRRGLDGAVKPKTGTLYRTFRYLLPFLRYLETLGLKHIGAVTPMVCATYVAVCKEERKTHHRKAKPLSARTLEKRFLAVEMLFACGQFTSTPMRSHPWPESSAQYLAGATRRGVHRRSKTPLIPDDVFTILFQEAWAVVQRGHASLDLRDGLGELAANLSDKPQRTIKDAKNRYLTLHGWERGLRNFTNELTDLRTACYIVVASLSGCRNHELAYVQTGACYRVEDEKGEVYWWMRSRSEKTGAGKTEWMVPEAAVEALRVMDRWAVPLQARIKDEIAQRRAADPLDPEIAEAQQHAGAVFLGTGEMGVNSVRTLSRDSCNLCLQSFAKRLNLDWNIASHQFRRKFANYAARSQFGDLRYLREHFQHWSQDMTNDSYALNESQEMELYAEIQDELDTVKLGLVELWLNPTEPLAGGYGKNLVAWRSREENIAMFKDHATMVRSVAESHAIRSNGHAWCTADDKECIGNTFEQTRCIGCDNAVIGRFHARLYQRAYDDLLEVARCDDIGQGGKARVLRDLERCRDVLVSIGFDPEAQAV